MSEQPYDATPRRVPDAEAADAPAQAQEAQAHPTLQFAPPVATWVPGQDEWAPPQGQPWAPPQGQPWAPPQCQPWAPPQGQPWAPPQGQPSAPQQGEPWGPWPGASAASGLRAGSPTPAPPRRRRRGVLVGVASLAIAGALGLNALGLTALAPGGLPTLVPTSPTPTASAPAVPATPAQTEQPVVAPGGASTTTASLSTGVVLIESTLAGGGTGAGTGMVLTADGQVLTNYHVVEQSTAVQVTIASTGKTYSATVVGRDATRDVALLQLTGASGLATVTIDDDPIAVGAQVTAVGNSKGAGRLTSATGVITDTSTSITVASETSASGSESLQGVIATNASAVPGDSGGPMFDSEGEVLGMTTAGSQQQSRRGQAVTVASFAVPIGTALQVVDQIRTGAGAGTTVVGGKAYLGVTLGASGLVVTEVVAGTPAAKAGLEAGDTITSLAGTPVTTRAGLAEVLAGKEPGDRASLGWTDASGRTRTATLTLGTSPVN